MKKKIYIDALYPEDARVVVHDGKRILDFDYESTNKKQLKGNIYLAKITRVEPSLQAAFIEYGGIKNGFLPFAEISPSYFNIPHEDKQLLEQQAQELADAADLVEGEEHEKSEIVEFDDGVEKFEEKAAAQKRNLYKKYKIQEVIKKGQVILVQVLKEERGNKGATFTSYISIAGKYCVLMPNSEKQSGISKKIFDTDDRKRLRDIVEELEIPDGVSLIIRTACAGRNKNDIKRDFDYLIHLWNNIKSHTLAANAPSFIHAEGGIVIKAIRDYYDVDTDEVIVQGEESYKIAKELMTKLIPSHAPKVKKYDDKIPIFTRYKIDLELNSLYNPVVTLESGGYIVITPTEAMISIDVNSGKSTSERNIEETAVKTNVEAAAEIARQLKLRDFSGLIVVDFIDMLEMNNRKLVEKKLRDFFQHDKARVQIGIISPFGLLEMSRQRVRSSIVESNTIVCPHCTGKGFIKSPEHNSANILKTIQAEAMDGDYEKINIYAHPDIIVYIINHKIRDILAIEDKLSLKVVFHKEYNISIDSFSMSKIIRDKKTKATNQPSIESSYSFDHFEDGQNFYEEIMPKKDNEEFSGEVEGADFSNKVFRNNSRRFRKQLPKKKPYDANFKPEPVTANTEQVNNSANGPSKPYNKNRNNYKGKKPRYDNSSKKAEEGFSLKKIWNKLIG
jgi:ribonuclease E